ncbi:hypothetical protein GCM10010336_51590 [Streptomyces goshikiensis]|nr:hypothetical protein GCM10010336_51590 [Streptomyces goshikiensis]
MHRVRQRLFPGRRPGCRDGDFSLLQMGGLSHLENPVKGKRAAVRTWTRGGWSPSVLPEARDQAVAIREGART